VVNSEIVINHVTAAVDQINLKLFSLTSECKTSALKKSVTGIIGLNDWIAFLYQSKPKVQSQMNNLEA
jgi:hypothetical protein